MSQSSSDVLSNERSPAKCVLSHRPLSSYFQDDLFSEEEGIGKLLDFDFEDGSDPTGGWDDYLPNGVPSGENGSGMGAVASTDSTLSGLGAEGTGLRRVFPGFPVQHGDSGDPVGAKPAGKGTMSRSFVFTVNTGEHFPDYQDRFSKVCASFDCRYGIIGAETAPSTGRRHYQGYIYRGTRLPWSKLCAALKEAFGVHPYVAVAKGDHEQNRAYCAKEGAYFEYGDLPRAGVS